MPRSVRFARSAGPSRSSAVETAIAAFPFDASAHDRQPWVVFGLLKTQDGVSPTVSSAEVWISLVGFTLLYGVLAVFAGKVFFRLAGEGPKVEEEEEKTQYF